LLQRLSFKTLTALRETFFFPVYPGRASGSQIPFHRLTLGQYGHSPQRGPRALPYPQGKRNKGKALTHQFIKITQILYVGNFPLPAHHMTEIPLLF
jgi:hypothetical protein